MRITMIARLQGDRDNPWGELGFMLERSAMRRFVVGE